MQHLIDDILQFMGGVGVRDGLCGTPMPGLYAFARHAPTQMEVHVYEPVVCLILQGRKETWLEDQRVSTGPGQTLIVSHYLPIKSRIVEADAERPYVALTQTVDLNVVRSLIEEIGDEDIAKNHPQSMSSHPSDESLTEVMSRAFALTKQLDDIKVMAPLIQREIHFRLLRAKHGGMLRELLNVDSSASRVTRAVDQIRARFREPISVPELARSVGMSSSSFHEHFKTVTAKTPLQYQKELRLLEARRLLLETPQPVSSVAFEVGYESPSQFSREFSRKFGTPPTQVSASG